MTGLFKTDPLLRIPPFPGARVSHEMCAGGSGAIPSALPIAALLDHLRAARVGGHFWADHPDLPAGEYRLLRPADTAQAANMLAEAREEGGGAILLWLPEAVAIDIPADPAVQIILGAADPWYMLSRASALWADDDDETAFIAALRGVLLRLCGNDGRFAALRCGTAEALEHVARQELAEKPWIDPFTAVLCPVERIIGYCAEWRRLIDANRPIAAAFGFGQWKQDTVDALLWNGTQAHTRFAPAQQDQLDALPDHAAIALWKARVPEAFLAACELAAHPVHEVEDGFIRSVGLGADCVPPLSIIVDPDGVHYDPSRPSGLENLLAHGDFTPELLERARQLRALIIESCISKYEVGAAAPLPRPGGTRRHILVPGQVEDDRSVMAGGGEVRGNLDLLRRARAAAPDAFILYKPHPDVLAGHRKGHVPEGDALSYADAIVGDQPISALLDMVDAVHVMTSLAGFEALLRGKPVTTHGVPFYAGWGLTTDLGAGPDRRGRARTLDELVAATLLLYPRYLDPVTGLPCPPEILIERLRSGTRRKNTILVMLRRAQGNLRRLFSGLRLAA